MLRTAVGILMVSGVVGLMAPKVVAHHSHIAYEPVKLLTFEGVVSEVRWRNPHMWIVIDVPVNGKVESWGFEGSSTSSTLASGISPKVLKVGARVKIVAHPSKNPESRTGLFMGMEINGKYYARGGGTNIRGTADGGTQ